MLITATNASILPALTDMTPVNLTGFEAHVIAGVSSPGSILCLATWAEDRQTHCTSPGWWGENWVKTMGLP